MKLKDSFRYQNFLDSILTKAGDYLSTTAYVTLTREKHLRSASNPGAADETIVVAERPFDCEVNALIDFVVHVLSEKEILSTAISVAKKNCAVDIDSAIALNRARQSAKQLMDRLAGVKSGEQDSVGKSYRLNNEGNQTTYFYKVKEIKTIDFDRNKVKGIAKALAAKSDLVSAELDRLVLSAEVDYTPKYDINDKFDDVLEAYVKGAN
jgi:hypothetical protein